MKPLLTALLLVLLGAPAAFAAGLGDPLDAPAPPRRPPPRAPRPRASRPVCSHSSRSRTKATRSVGPPMKV
ncbi:hypothetical protein OFL32_31080, partial [Pseudomonas aeruginosa]|nr:hypothetical protein [Pseudomonas aeruginosa]